MLLAKARTLSLRDVFTAGEEAAFKTFCEMRWPETEGEEHARVVAELRAADRRMRVINNSILAAVACGIVVCLLVALLFTQAFTGLNLGVAASWAFALAMLLLLASLLLFLLEVRLAIRAIQVPMDLLEGEEAGWLRRSRR